MSEIRKALEPFAKIADEYDDRESDAHPIWADAGEAPIREALTLGNCRAARKALASPQPDPVAEIVAWLRAHESSTARNLADEISRRFGSKP